VPFANVNDRSRKSAPPNPPTVGEFFLPAFSPLYSARRPLLVTRSVFFGKMSSPPFVFSSLFLSCSVSLAPFFHYFMFTRLLMDPLALRSPLSEVSPLLRIILQNRHFPPTSGKPTPIPLFSFLRCSFSPVYVPFCLSTRRSFLKFHLGLLSLYI